MGPTRIENTEKLQLDLKPVTPCSWRDKNFNLKGMDSVESIFFPSR